MAAEVQELERGLWLWRLDARPPTLPPWDEPET
jgi:hypothetical protein